MNYKEILFFLGKSLTLKSCPERIEEVKQTIESDVVDWESFVWVTSNQMMIPAVYLQYKWANLLKYLPQDLVEYLESIYQLNYDRNSAIIKQTHKLIKILNKGNLQPVFLKGVANLLNGLYDDIGERMIGDIDFIVPKDKVEKAADILIKSGYTTKGAYKPEVHKKQKHYPRLINNNEIAAVEVHFRATVMPFDNEFSYDLIDHDKRKLDVDGEAYAFSYKNQIVHNAFVVQTELTQKYSNTIYLRHMYDLLLLSKYEDTLKSLVSFDKYVNFLNNYLALSSSLLSSPSSISFKRNWNQKIYTAKFMFDINHLKYAKVKNKLLYFKYMANIYIGIIIRSFYRRKEFHFVYSRMFDLNWYLNKFNAGK